MKTWIDFFSSSCQSSFHRLLIFSTPVFVLLSQFSKLESVVVFFYLKEWQVCVGRTGTPHVQKCLTAQKCLMSVDLVVLAVFVQKSNWTASRGTEASPEETKLGQGLGGPGDHFVFVLPDGRVQDTDVLVVITGFLQRRHAVTTVVLEKKANGALMTVLWYYCITTIRNWSTKGSSNKSVVASKGIDVISSWQPHGPNHKDSSSLGSLYL